MEIEPGLIHSNKGYGHFSHCPFCKGEANFSIQFDRWHNKKENCTEKDYDFLNNTEECAGYMLTVICPNCTISMREPRRFPYGEPVPSKETLLSYEFYKDKFNGSHLQGRWNRRDG